MGYPHADLLVRGGAAGAELDAAPRQVVDHGHALGHAHGEEVVLDEPYRVEAHPIGQHGLLDGLLDHRVIVDHRPLHLVGQAEPHAPVSLAASLPQLAGEFGKVAGVDVTVDLINMNDLHPRIASAIETKSGPDIIMISNWPHLYADGLADVDDLAEEIAKRDGAYYEHNYALVFLSSPQQKTIPIGVFTELVRGDVFSNCRLLTTA